MTDRDLLKQALEALDWAADCIEPQKPINCDCPVCFASNALRERLAQPEQETETQKLSDKAWAAIWEEFAWESEVTTDKEFQKEMVKKHGKGHYYMDAEETWNRQKDLIQKLVNARLKEQNA